LTLYNVVCNGSIGTPLAATPTEAVFVPPTMPVIVTSGTQLAVDLQAVALESDISASLGIYVAVAGVGSDASVGTSAFNSITSITTSPVLTKAGTEVVLKQTVDFDTIIGSVWMIPGTPPVASTIYIVGYTISCSLTWTTVQTKLKAEDTT